MASTWDSVAIIGVGLIGGSIGLAARQKQVASRVVGIGRDEGRLELARECGAVTESTTQLSAGVAEADLIIVCAPVDRIPQLVEQTAANCRPDALITDAGSTKRHLVERIEAQSAPGQASFIGSHPLAGSEKTGVAHARGDLFEDRTVVVTPTDRTSTAEIKQLSEFWEQLGANVCQMSPADHDEALAKTSHLPHLIASALAASTPAEHLPLVATGWKDTTRIAAGDVELWQQIMLHNRASIRQSLTDFQTVLDSFAQALEQNDGTALSNLLATGKQRRDAMAD